MGGISGFDIYEKAGYGYGISEAANRPMSSMYSFQVLYNSLCRGLAVMDMVKSWEQDIPLY